MLGGNLSDLMPVDQALERILARFTPKPEEFCSLNDSYGRVLSRDILASTDLPSFTNSSMDGFAVIASDVKDASRENPISLIVDYDIPAGSQPTREITAGHAARIMTGAPLPPGTNAIVPVEETDADRYSTTSVFPFSLKVMSSAKVGDYVRPQGMDIHAGDLVIRKSTCLRPQEISALASQGIHQVPVFRSPRVAILSTGDELIPPEEPLSPGKIHESNSYSLLGLSKSLGCEVFNLGIVRDDKSEIQARLDRCCDLQIDLIITSAGVSVGAYDLVKQVIGSHGQIDFWRVNMRPGKPIAFGSYRSIPLIGLAGNPVSAFVGFLVFIRPVLFRLSGMQKLTPDMVTMILDEGIESDGRQSYLRANSRFENGKWIAHPASHQGSGNVLSMVNANTLLIIPSGVKSLPINSLVNAWLID
jgi:molybdopterin molybdotransferase